MIKKDLFVFKIFMKILYKDYFLFLFNINYFLGYLVYKCVKKGIGIE